MAKGNVWEIEVARILTEWMTGSRNPPELWRSNQSGGWKHRDVADIGDLRPNGPVGEEFRNVFAVECKHRREEETDFWFEFSRPESRLAKWWTKHERECWEANLIPLVIIKRNYYPTIIGTYTNLIMPGFVGVALTVNHLGATFTKMDDFLAMYTYEEMMENGRQFLQYGR